MATVIGEIRDGRVVCHWLGCKELAAFDHETGICVACAEHWQRYKDGEDFPVPPPQTGATYVMGTAKASTAAPIYRNGFGRKGAQ